MGLMADTLWGLWQIATHEEYFDHPTYKYLAFATREANYDGERRLDYLAHGFLSEKELVYDFDTHGLDDYITDLQWEGRAIDVEWLSALEDKISMHDNLEGHGLNLPIYYGLVTEDGVFVPECPKTADTIMELIERGKVIAKPRNAMAGRGVYVPDSLYEVREKAKEDTILTERLEPNLQEIHGTNIVSTTRIHTMKDPETGEVFVPRSVQRIPTSELEVVDNFSQGAISTIIQDGELGQGKIKYGGYMEKHPDTGVRFRGKRLPGYHEAEEKVKEVFDNLDGCKVAGWDVVLYEDHMRVIEVNAVPGVQILQSHGPLLRDQRVEKFYEYHSPRRGLPIDRWKKMISEVQ